MISAELTDRVERAVRMHVSPNPSFPQATVWEDKEVRLRLSVGQAHDIARVLGVGTRLPLGMEVPYLGVRTSIVAEIDDVSTLHMPERSALRFIDLLEEADRTRREHSPE